MDFEKVLEILKYWEMCGTKKTKNGTQLICNVPHIAPEAWLHEIYLPLSKENVSKLETQLQKCLPRELKQFYGVANGINLFSDSLSIWGQRFSYERVGEALPQPYDIVTLNEENSWYNPKELLFFGSYSWDGSQMVYDLSSETDAVFRIRNGSTEILNKWPSFWEWLSTETQRLAILFDAKGIEHNPEIPNTPDN